MHRLRHRESGKGVPRGEVQPTQEKQPLTGVGGRKTGACASEQAAFMRCKAGTFRRNHPISRYTHPRPAQLWMEDDFQHRLMSFPASLDTCLPFSLPETHSPLHTQSLRKGLPYRRKHRPRSVQPTQEKRLQAPPPGSPRLQVGESLPETGSFIKRVESRQRVQKGPTFAPCRGQVGVALAGLETSSFPILYSQIFML